MLPTPHLRPLHLVSGDSAAACLHAACANCGLPGTVVGFSGDLAHGPLDDAEASVAYLRAIAQGYGESETADASPFTQWRAVGERLTRERPAALIVWAGDNVADAVFIAMACDQLAGRREPLWRVSVPEVERRPYVAMHSPEQLSHLYASRVLLSDAARLSLAQDFARIRDSTGLVRRLEGGCVVGVPVEHYDPWLLAACCPDWQAAARVVGTAMGNCDGHNLMGDAFFASRLRALIQAGRIEAHGPQTTFLDCSVRLAAR